MTLAAADGGLRRLFIWGSLVTAKQSPKDLDLLLIMDEDFKVNGFAAPAQAIFDSVRAKLMFESDIFWARNFSNFGWTPIRRPRAFVSGVS